MPDMHDLAPAAAQMQRVVHGVDDDRLDAPTPCEGWSVTDLVRHVIGLTAAFTAAATKGAAPDSTPGLDLPAGWRSRLHERLDELVTAWRAPEAWEGDAEAGGVVMPAEVMGVVALDELVLHGWDLARATGQSFHADPADVAACLGFAAAMSEPGQEAGREGLYGPVVPVPPDALPLDRLLGFAGRDRR